MRSLTLALSIFANGALAAPEVLTDIAPVQAIVADVMGELGQPNLLLPPDVDAHHYALRPSDAHRLGQAEAIIWIGPQMTPWLTKSLDSLASETPRLALATSDDPHLWLDPAMAAAAATDIAAWLSDIDPQNADQYGANAETAAARYMSLMADIDAGIAPVRDRTILWPHDGYRFFERAFGLTSAGAIANTHAHEPGPAHIAELRDLVHNGGVDCVLLDAEINETWLTPVLEGATVKTGAIDPLGVGLPTGQGFYPSLIRQMGAAITDCLTPPT